MEGCPIGRSLWRSLTWTIRTLNQCMPSGVNSVPILDPLLYIQKCDKTSHVQYPVATQTPHYHLYNHMRHIRFRNLLRLHPSQYPTPTPIPHSTLLLQHHTPLSPPLPRPPFFIHASSVFSFLLSPTFILSDSQVTNTTVKILQLTPMRVSNHD